MLIQKLQGLINQELGKLYGGEFEIELQATNKNHTGDYTLVVFPFTRFSKKKPEETATQVGEILTKNIAQYVSSFEVIKGFLNLTLTTQFFYESLSEIVAKSELDLPKKDNRVLVEYSSPNTNKPLHLGHIRNNLLGDAVVRLLQAAGNEVLRTQIINDRGIHICKSMLAWKEHGNGITPQEAGKKGDKLVGDFYVKFDQIYKAEITELVAQGKTEDEAKKTAPSLLKAQQMLTDWENGDEETLALWKTMNGWVYEGFEETYKKLRVHFDFVNYESETYLLGKDKIKEGLDKGIFFQEEDGSTWVDLEAEKMDKKILLRSDGTSVYITQDIGTAISRIEEHKADGLIYTVGDEQNYHFKVLFAILKKLGYEWADKLHHLSYGMVNLPTGKMKSREGTVVDADDLIDDLVNSARETSLELGKLNDMNDTEKGKLFEDIGLAALKYFILKVDPQKSMLFNPQESIDFQGNTGPFIQYTHARIQSILRKKTDLTDLSEKIEWTEKEKDLIVQMSNLQGLIEKAAKGLNPAMVANYAYDLAKSFNTYYQNTSILNAENDDTVNFRATLAKEVARHIKYSMNLLGISVPEKM